MIPIPPKPSVPCKDCDNKGCGTYHSICKEYQTYVQQQTAYRNAMNEITKENSKTTSYIEQAIRRNKKYAKFNRKRN